MMQSTQVQITRDFISRDGALLSLRVSGCPHFFRNENKTVITLNKKDLILSKIYIQGNFKRIYISKLHSSANYQTDSVYIIQIPARPSFRNIKSVG